MRVGGYCMYYLRLFLIVPALSLFIRAAIAAAQGDIMTLTLDKALNRGMEQSGKIGMARADAERQKGLDMQNSWLPNPYIDINYKEIPRWKSFSYAGEEEISVSQVIPFPSKMVTRRTMFSKLNDAANRKIETTRIDTRAEIKAAYYVALFRQSALRLAEQNLSLSREFQEKAGLKYRVGESSYLEAVQSNVEATNARQQHIDAQMLFETALADLKRVLYIDQNIGIMLLDSLVFESVSIQKDILFSEQFQQHNPELLDAHLRAEAAGHAVSLARQEFIPDIELKGLKQRVGDVSNLYGFSVGFSLPVWFFTNEKGRIQEAKAVKKEMDLAREEVKRTIARRIHQAFAETERDKARVYNYMRELLPMAEESFLIARHSYLEGEIGYIEYLEAQRTYIKSRSEHLRALLDYNLAVSELERAAGIKLTDNQ